MLGDDNARRHGFWARNKVTIVMLLVVALFIGVILTGVLVTRLQREGVCSDSGTTHAARTYEYAPGKRTGVLDICVQADGRITRVFNDEITEVDDTQVIGDSSANRHIFAVCKDVGGRVYETEHQRNKRRVSRPGPTKRSGGREKRWICVLDAKHYPIDLPAQP